MGRKRPIVHMTVDPLMRKVLDAVADELDITRSRLTETLTAGGFRDVLKAAGEAEIPFSEDVGRSVSGSAAHSEQVKISEASRLAWTPKDQYAEDTVQKPLRLGPIERPRPTYVHEGVVVESRGFPGGSPYQAALRALKKGAISKSDIKAVLKMGGGIDVEIEEICKSLDAVVDKIDVDLKKTARAQEEWEKGWERTLRKHARTLGYSK